VATASPAGFAWSLVQVADLLARAREPFDEAVSVLGADLVAALVGGEAVALEAERVAQFKDAALELVDLVDQLAGLVERLAVERLDVDPDAARLGALADLAAGILDPCRVLLAARLLGVREGCAALADALRGTGAHVAWGEMSLQELLGCLRGVDPSLAVGVAARAGVPGGLVLAQADQDEIERVATALERHAAG
jgi:hypothetical protein